MAQGWFSQSTDGDNSQNPLSSLLLADWNSYAAAQSMEESSDAESSLLLRCTFAFTEWLVQHKSCLEGRRIIELGRYLHSNYLSGVFPSEIGNLSQLQILDISSNSFSGSIPLSLGKLYNLKNFFLENLGLCGVQINTPCKNDDVPNSSPQSSSSEYMQSGRATEKTDVYSFGVLVLEVLSGKRPTDASFIEKGLNIVGWLNHLITENRARDLVDQQCEGVQAESLDALLSVAIPCISSSPDARPTMHRVVQLIESEVVTPCPSDFYDSNSE